MRKGKENSQIVEYDCLRIIATILVVLGHCTYYKIITDFGGCDYSSFVGNGCTAFQLFQKIKGFIYLFHMPLFMALSGALFYRSILKEKYTTLKQISKDKGKRLLIPFIVVSLCYSVPLKYISGYFLESENIFKDILFGQLLVQGNSHLWYCETLFFIFLISFILEKHYKGKICIKLLALLFFSLLSSKININLISYICEYVFWFYIGFYFEKVRERVNKAINWRTWIFGTVVLMIVYYVYHVLYGKKSVLLKAALALVDIIFTCIACLYTYIIAYFIAKSRLIDTQLFENLRTNSFGVYLYSDPWNYVILYIGTMLFGSSMYINNVGATALFCVRFLGTLIISLIVTKLLKKCKLKLFI